MHAQKPMNGQSYHYCGVVKCSIEWSIQLIHCQNKLNMLYSDHTIILSNMYCVQASANCNHVHDR